MKDYQELIGRLVLAAAVLAAGLLIANAVEAGCASIGSQIAAAIAIS